MGLFFIYILKSGTALILFYLFYKLLLSRETFHRFNRITLLCLLTASSVLPFLQWKKEPASGTIAHGWMDISYIQIQEATWTSPAKTVPFILYILLFIYLLGLFFFICHTLLGYVQLYRYIHGREIIELENGIRLILTDQQETPFSWMKYVIISKTDWEESGKEILTHESGHIRLHHSWNRMLTQVCILLHWFNPAAWLIRRELEHIHEYEADDYVLNKGIDAKKYQLLLIKKAVGSQRFTSMANSFNHSKLKKENYYDVKS